MLRNYGNIKFYTGCKLSNGIIRNNHRLLEFSDRDLARFTAPLGIRAIGKHRMNRKLIETCDQYQPDLILMGHCDLIESKTLLELRTLCPHTKIAHWFLDALWIPRNIQRLQARMHCTDALFVTTGGEPLKQFCTGHNKVAFIPNPTDPSWEPHKNDQKDHFDRDLVFCGVGSREDERYKLLVRLKEELHSTVRFDTYGILGGPPVWGQAYDQIIANSKMALNLNREEGWPLYSSDRLSQLLGNGILTYLWDKGDMRRLFSDQHVVYFKNETELKNKVEYYHNHDEERKRIASSGRSYYQQYFSAEKVIQFIVNTTLGGSHARSIPWIEEVYG